METNLNTAVSGDDTVVSTLDGDLSFPDPGQELANAVGLLDKYDISMDGLSNNEIIARAELESIRHLDENGQHAPDLVRMRNRALREQEDALAEERAAFAEAERVLEAEQATSWFVKDLNDVLYGDARRLEPTMFLRADGVPLIYPGKTHAFVGESESMKSWAALVVCAEQLVAGHVILFIDFEDDEFGFVERLIALGVPRDAIRDRAAYIRPTVPLSDEKTRQNISRVHAYYGDPVLVVLDGVTECMTLHGWDPNVGTDVVKFLDLYPRRMSSGGAALIFIDHVTKNPERGRYAIGSVHKLNGIDGASYTFDPKTPLDRKHAGKSLVYVNKDRPGYVRQFAEKKIIAEMNAVPNEEDGSVTITLDRPVAAEDFTPTVLMERVSRFLEGAGPSGVRAIRQGVVGMSKYKDEALRLLIDEEYVAVEDGKNRSRLHRSIKPYREPSAENDWKGWVAPE